METKHHPTLINNLLNIIKLIFHPFLKLYQEILELKKYPEDCILSIISISCITLAWLVGFIYYSVSPPKQNFLNSLLDMCNISHPISRKLLPWLNIILLESYIGNYMGNIICKLYCLAKFGTPKAYLSQYRLEKITQKLVLQGYNNIDSTILLEIIKFCINNTRNDSTNILGNHTVDWEHTIKHLMNADLEYFLEQQSLFRHQRKIYIRKILCFYVYHNNCHQKTASGNKIASGDSSENLSNQSLLIDVSKEPARTYSTFSTHTQDSRSTEYNILHNTQFDPELLDNNNNVLLLFRLLEKDNIVISNQHMQSTIKQYKLFKRKNIKKTSTSILNEYQEYLCLNNYENYLYNTASEISVSIFPEEILNHIAENQKHPAIPKINESFNMVHSFIYQTNEGNSNQLFSSQDLEIEQITQTHHKNLAFKAK